MMADQRGMWERIAASFDRSRRRTWPHVEAFLDGLPAGTRLLDLMAGNGRHTPPWPHAHWCDWSHAMARRLPPRLARNAVVADATQLPFRDAVFDAALYVAGLHGLPTAAKRVASLRELRRVLRPGAPAQVTVWSRGAPRFSGQGPPGPIDVVLPWRAEGHEERRAYHLHTLPSLLQALEDAGLRVENAGSVAVASAEPDNLVVVARR